MENLPGWQNFGIVQYAKQFGKIMGPAATHPSWPVPWENIHCRMQRTAAIEGKHYIGLLGLRLAQVTWPNFQGRQIIQCVRNPTF